MTAIDRDVGKNGEVQYTLVEGGEGHFTIDSSTGLIIVREPLGANSQNKNFTLKIKASDKGNEIRKEFQIWFSVMKLNKKTVFDFMIENITVLFVLDLV